MARNGARRTPSRRQQNSNLIKDERGSDSQTYVIRKAQSGVIVLASRENGTKKQKPKMFGSVVPLFCG
eukprot:6214447-Pleurochrysis_carterae.AAC.3